MGYRFRKKKRIIDFISGTRFSIVFFVCVLTVFILAVGNISKDTTEREEQALCDAINRSVVSCYCVEGTYPPSLDYLKTHYGLTYDDSAFFVDYIAYGSNIYPEITILRRK